MKEGAVVSKAKKEEKKGARKDEQRVFLVQQRSQGKWILGWGTCNAKGNKRLLLTFSTFSIYTFHPPIVLYSRKAQTTI